MSTSTILGLRTDLRKSIVEVLCVEDECAGNTSDAKQPYAWTQNMTTTEQNNATITEADSDEERSSNSYQYEIDVTKLSNNQIKALQYKLAKEQQGRAEKNCKSTFVVGHWNGDSNCIMVPNHKNETAFQGYHTHNPYIERFTELVGGGDANVGASRILSVLIRKFPKEYLEEGKKKGMTMNTMFDEVALAALTVDCNLKNWQLKKVLKHFQYTTGCTPSVAVDKAMKELARDAVIPRTDTAYIETNLEDGKVEIESITFDYQSIVEVFKHIVAELIMEAHAGIHNVAELFIILGGDHGIGAFRIPFRTLVLLRDGTILKKDIGVATVMSKKDSAKVFQNTVEPWLTADLKTINQSQVILTTDVSGFVQCTFLPKDEYQNSNVFSKHTLKVICTSLGI